MTNEDQRSKQERAAYAEQSFRRLFGDIIDARPPAASAGSSFALAGAFRVYWNRHNADGLKWCVAPEAGGWELACRDVVILTPCRSMSQTKATPDDEDGRPSGWFAVVGRLEMGADGVARIVPS